MAVDGVWLSFSAKATDFEKTLSQAVENFKELVLDTERMQNQLQSYASELLSCRERCESQKCPGAENFKQVVDSKNNIIQLAASTAIRIDETKNLNLISQLINILCGNSVILTPPKESQDGKENFSSTTKSTPSKDELHSNLKTNTPLKKRKLLTTSKEFNMSDVSVKEESMSEIDGTPGRTSPIFQSKKMKTSSSISNLSGASTESREKKKLLDEMVAPETKQMKLSRSSGAAKGSGKSKLRQSRLILTNHKSTCLVDLTCSPELSENPNSQAPVNTNHHSQVQLLIKKESSDNDDTILPSPTSGPITNNILPKTSVKDSVKANRKLSLVKKNEEVDFDVNSPIIQVVEKKPKIIPPEADDREPMEESINILKPNRFPKSPNKLTIIKTERHSPVLCEPPTNENDPNVAERTEQILDRELLETDATHCDSMSILQQVNQLEQAQKSPFKKPLCENVNVMNVQPVGDAPSNERTETSDGRRKVVPVYKEPAPRRKADKAALPGWCCDECVQFFNSLYGSDAARVSAAVARCSKHRGRADPARPRTPPGFWKLRWDVPQDTEEFNRRNDAQ